MALLKRTVRCSKTGNYLRTAWMLEVADAITNYIFIRKLMYVSFMKEFGIWNHNDTPGETGGGRMFEGLHRVVIILC